MAYVSRGVVTTTFTAYDSMNPENAQELSVSGKISPARLAARARKIIGPTAAVRDVVTETRTYRMSLEDFVNFAEIVNE